MKTPTRFAALAGVLLLACGGVWGWFYYTKHFSLPEAPFSQSQRAPKRPAVGAIVLAAPSNTAPPAASETAAPPPSTEPPPPTFTLPWDALDDFRQSVNKSLLSELGASFPDLSTALSPNDTATINDPVSHRVTFQLLDAYNAAPADKKPALLLAADLAATRLWCDVNHVSPVEQKPTCPDLQADLSKYGLGLHYDEMGGGFFYRRELLWRVWQNYPESSAGEQAFVTLLEDGWDPSGTCEKGGDQTREVIRRGEEFLQKHPGSPYRAVVTYQIAEAYASWWSLSKMRSGSGLADYVDPKEFQEGADAARLKAIEYFQQVAALAPGTKLDKYAQLAIEPLRNKEILKEPRFFCVHD